MTMTVLPQVFSYHLLGIHKDKLRSEVLKFVLTLKLCLQGQDTLREINGVSTLASFRSQDSVHHPGKNLTSVLWEVHYWWIVFGLKIKPQSLVLCCWLFLGTFPFKYSCFRFHPGLPSSCLYSDEASCIGFLIPCQKPSIPNSLYLSLVSSFIYPCFLLFSLLEGSLWSCCIIQIELIIVGICFNIPVQVWTFQASVIILLHRWLKTFSTNAFCRELKKNKNSHSGKKLLQLFWTFEDKCLIGLCSLRKLSLISLMRNLRKWPFTWTCCSEWLWYKHEWLHAIPGKAFCKFVVCISDQHF